MTELETQILQAVAIRSRTMTPQEAELRAFGAGRNWDAATQNQEVGTIQ